MPLELLSSDPFYRGTKPVILIQNCIFCPATTAGKDSNASKDSIAIKESNSSKNSNTSNDSIVSEESVTITAV